VGVVLVSVAEVTRDILDCLSELLRVLRFHRVGVMDARQFRELANHFVFVVRLTFLSVSNQGKTIRWDSHRCPKRDTQTREHAKDTGR